MQSEAGIDTFDAKYLARLFGYEIHGRALIIRSSRHNQNHGVRGDFQSYD